MKFSTFVILVALLGVQVRADIRLLNGVAVQVNDTIITWKEIFSSIEAELDFLEIRHGHQPEVWHQRRNELVRNAMDEMIERQLILHEYRTKGYQLPESYMQDRINRDIREYGDRATLTKTLQAQGVTFDGYRKRVRERIIVDAMSQQHVPSDPVISPFRIETYYKENLDQFRLDDQVKLHMISLPHRPGSQRKLAEEILSKIEEGAPFADMARIYSQDMHREEGGARGWVQPRVELLEALAGHALSLEPGQVSGIIELDDATYLMLIEETRPAHIRPLAELRDEIETILKREERARLNKQWIQRLRDRAFVRFFD